MVYSGKKDYLNGVGNFYRKHYSKARKCLEKASLDPVYRQKAFKELMYIDLKEGKYASVRERLEKNIVSNFYIYGLLESIEYNYEASIKHYNNCIINNETSDKVIIDLARVYMQMGDYEVAQDLFNSLLNDDKYYIEIMIDLVCLSILKEDYDAAFKTFSSIDKSKLCGRYLEDYANLKMYLDYFMGKKMDSSCDSYRFNVLSTDSDNYLLDHIESHKNEKYRYTNGCFFNNIDLKDIIYKVSEIIEVINANYFGLANIYRFSLDDYIGYKGNDMTKDICVVTIIGTKKIITIYPIMLSKCFDSENMLYSESLKIKRKTK